jgi:ELWxxDGT repeat protein
MVSAKNRAGYISSKVPVIRCALVALFSFVLASCFVPVSEVPFRPGQFTAAPSPVADIVPGPTGSDPEWLTEFNGKLFFAADDPTVGRELFSYDGETLRLVADLNPGADDSSPEGLIEYSGDLYFAATTPSTGYELWRYNGTGVESVGEVDPGAADGIILSNRIVFDSHLFFSADSPTAGEELYYYHPSFAAPQLFEDVNPGVASSFPGTRESFAVLNGTLYFGADQDGYGVELFKLGGTDQSVQRAAYIAGDGADLIPAYFAVYDEKLYFGADSDFGFGGGDFELWVYDPAETGAAGTRGSLVESIRVSDDRLTDLYVHDDRLYLRAEGGTGWELFVYDGTSITEVNGNNDTSASNPRDFQTYNGALYYGATGPNIGNEVWTLRDGVASPVTDAVPGTGNLNPYEFTVVGDSLYMRASFPETGSEIFKLH